MTPMNAGEATSLKSTTRNFLDIIPGYGAFFKPMFLLHRRFHCIVFGGDFHDLGKGVFGLCRENAISSLYCLDIEDGADLPAFRFAPTHENLKAVRREYHTPSYVIGDEAGTFLIVSDSDYYWGFAAGPTLVATLAARNCGLRQTRASLQGYFESEYEHDRRIGEMLSAFLGVCEAAGTAVT